MAQRLLHLALANEISKRIDIKDKYRLLLGSIIPDSNISVQERDRVHYLVRKGLKRNVNFTKFFNDYKEKILVDDMYLGYYIHLLEDSLYRIFMYQKKGLNKKREEKDFVDKMHLDYKNLNYYIKKKYNLENIKVNTNDIPIEFGLTALEDLKNLLDTEFNDKEGFEYNYLNEKMIDEYFEFTIDILIEEILYIRDNKDSKLNSNDFWY